MYLLIYLLTYMGSSEYISVQNMIFFEIIPL